MRTLGAPNGDIDFTVVDGLEAVRQRVEQALLFHKSEWFLDTRRGVPYLADVLGYPVDVTLAQQVIAAFILRDEEVTSVDVSEVRFEPTTRTVFFKATVQTQFGEMGMESET